MEHYHLMLALLVGGFLMLGIGFNYRRYEWGVGLLGLGVLLMLVPIALHIHLTLN
ncbi:hypothetical protein [Pseudomonas sp. NCCP-436]|uniref:hypothetical protein n=1 Tax=Pseudomonas sp. NCCP-436 TaxID=2842481 RepID=UPI001C7F09B6|nr:hypothetical protein [Pseudomonas sp. NCCP-436]GIZ13590.1 hypothetical protein NCCP436_30060 [Pseudomonas sp. NCCP-436]